MHIIVNRAELLNAVRRAAAIAPASAPLDVLEGVLLETDAGNGRLTLTATDLEIALKQDLLCDTKEDDAFAVKAELLAGMLDKLPGDRVELRRMPGKPILTLRGGESCYELPLWERGSYPTLETPFPEDTVKVTGIPSLAAQTVFATTEDKEKPLLKCVDLKFTQDGLRCAGSNGICAVTVKGDEKSTGSAELLLPARSLKRLAGLCDDTDEFRVGRAGPTLVFMKEGFTFSARLMDGIFINTDALLSSIKEQFVVLTDVRELRQALDSVRVVGPDTRVMLAFDGTKLTLRCQGVYGNASADLDVAPLTGAPSGEYWFGTAQLLSSLRALSGTARLGIAQGGMLTLNTEGASYMQTAMRAPAEKKAETPAKPKKPRKKPDKEAA